MKSSLNGKIHQLTEHEFLKPSLSGDDGVPKLPGNKVQIDTGDDVHDDDVNVVLCLYLDMGHVIFRLVLPSRFW